MQEIKEYLFSLLSTVGKTVTAFPQKGASFPCLVLTMRSQKTALQLAGRDRLQEISFTVTVCDQAENSQRKDGLQQSVRTLLAQHGFSLTNCAESREGRLFASALQYTCFVDEERKMIYGEVSL